MPNAETEDQMAQEREREDREQIAEKIASYDNRYQREIPNLPELFAARNGRCAYGAEVIDSIEHADVVYVAEDLARARGIDPVQLCCEQHTPKLNSHLQRHSIPMPNARVA